MKETGSRKEEKDGRRIREMNFFIFVIQG